MIKINAIRTDCLTGETKDVVLDVIKEFHKELDSWWIKIVNGVTGYESCQVDTLESTVKGGWFACAGTKGRWDSLFIPENEMKKIQKELGQNEHSQHTSNG